MEDHSQSNEKNFRQLIWHRISDKSKAPRRWGLPAEPIIFADDEQWQRQHDEVSSTIRRVMLAIVAYSLFCILALGAPDVNLIASNANIKLPFADTEVSYSGFLIAGPLILVGLFIYLHVFVGYLGKLAPPSTRVSLPFIFNMPSSFSQWLADVLLYYLVPVVLLVFSWKAAPRSEGIWLFSITLLLGACIIYLKILRFRWGTPPTKLQRARCGALWLMLVLLCGIAVYTPTLPFYRPLMLSKADLSGLDLRQSNLKYANLAEANLEGADLRNSNLQGANLDKANLQGANLSSANLQGVDLSSAKLKGVDLSSTNLQGFNLREAKLQGADLSSTQLQGADLTSAKLRGADLSRAQLQGANLNFAKLQEANLKKVNLQGASLRNAKLQGAVLQLAKLQGADLSSAKLQGVDLFKAQLQGADLRKVNLQGAILGFANLQGVSLRHVDLLGADLRGVDIWKTQLPRRIDPELTDLSNVKITPQTENDRKFLIMLIDDAKDTYWGAKFKIRLEPLLLDETENWGDSNEGLQWKDLLQFSPNPLDLNLVLADLICDDGPRGYIARVITNRVLNSGGNKGSLDRFSRRVSDVNCSGAKMLDVETKLKLCESSTSWSEVDIKKSTCAN